MNIQWNPMHHEVKNDRERVKDFAPRKLQTQYTGKEDSKEKYERIEETLDEIYEQSQKTVSEERELQTWRFLLSIWIKPKKTIREIVNTNPRHLVLTLSAVRGIVILLPLINLALIYIGLILFWVQSLKHCSIYWVPPLEAYSVL